MSQVAIFGWTALILLAFMVYGFILAVIKTDFSIVDVAYGLGYVLVAIVAIIWKGTWYPKEIIVVAMVTIWGVRLAQHVYRRNKKSKVEDFRYQEMRKRWEPHANLRAFYKIFLFQGGIIYIVDISVVFIVVFSEDAALNWISWIGMAIWGIGFFFEAVGDAQLRKFIKNPANRGKIMMGGLWKYTRHPNYFGEATMWWGLSLIALSVGNAFPLTLITLVSPILITYMLLKVSGVPMLEKHYEGNPAYEAYKAKTSIFIPFPPKKAKKGSSSEL